MNSRIYTGEVMHSRRAPVVHSFRYPIYVYAFDLDELDALEQSLFPLFGHNKWRPVSLLDRDYLTKGSAAIRAMLFAHLERAGVDTKEIARVELVTAARYLGYVFNPVSFHYCYRADGSVRAIVAEINNTFGERHLYICDDLDRVREGFAGHYAEPKSFHVSPFNDMHGTYDFQFWELGDALDIRIDIVRDGGRKAFLSRLSGRAAALTRANLARTLLRYPLTASLTMPRILWEAAKLHYGKKLPVFTKPNPSSALTIGVASPTWSERMALAATRRFFSGMKVGAFEIIYPDRESEVFGDPHSERRATIHVRSWRVFREWMRGADIAFGETYTNGDWDTDDLTGLLALFLDNREHAQDEDVRSAWFGRLLSRLFHLRRANTRAGSKRNIAEHYDLSNDFYRLFLDPSMMYSCALFCSEEDTLEAAQLRKVRAMIAKAHLRPEHHLLEIGTGWGTLAIEAARSTGCRVTSITLSEEQLKLARERVAAEGLSDRIDVRLCDYRDIDGKFDRIVSIEMLEAVGHEYLPAFFRRCDELLKPGGIAVIQTITMPDDRYEAYRRSCDWIQKYIFPGSICPSVSAVVAAMAKGSRLQLHHAENIGIHYARTLREWRERLEARREEVLQLGFDRRFLRMWEYYLCYCEAGFGTRTLGTFQLVLSRANNGALPKYEVGPNDHGNLPAGCRDRAEHGAHAAR